MDTGMYVINCQALVTLWMGIKVGADENRSWDVEVVTGRLLSPRRATAYMHATLPLQVCVYICVLIYTHESSYTMYIYD